MTILELEKLLAKTQWQPDGCWHWAGSKSRGYGYFYAQGRQRPAHLWLYEEIYGPVPDGLELDHICHNQDCFGGEKCPHRSCANWRHLEAVPKRVNMERGRVWRVNVEKTHCRNGHLFDEANTHFYKTERVCRACAREKTRRYRLRQGV